MKTPEQIATLRSTYKIPACYGKGGEMPDERILFDYCDSTIRIHPDGSADETHMGLGFEGHEFVTRPWPHGSTTGAPNP